MAKPRALILRAPGANCDGETQFALEQAGALAERLHINRLREQPSLLHRFQILVVPGGFTYGDRHSLCTARNCFMLSPMLRRMAWN